MVLLLVEDEPYTREGILTEIDWDLLGITKVLTAEDGKEGLEMARKHSPNIVLTDMYMPKMDGAVMSKAIREILPDCALIFISGYSDIDYYKSAVKVSAVDFVTKPLVIEELMKVLEKSIRQVKDRSEKNECYVMHKSNELAKYIINENAFPNKLMDLWIDYGLPYDEKHTLHTLILKMRHSSKVILLITELAKETSIKACSGSIEIGYVIHVAIPLTNTFLLNSFSQKLMDEFSDEATYLAIGKPVSQPLALSQSYCNAIDLIKLSFFYPERQVFTYKETALSLVNEYDLAYEMSQLLCCNPSKAKQWVNKQFDIIRNHAGTPIELVKYWVFKMCTELHFHFYCIKKSNIQSTTADETELWDKISSLNTLDSLKELVLEIIDMHDCSSMTDENSKIIRKVQRYIFNNYYKPLSLKSISEHVNLSATYLCGLFKGNTGQTINNYILEVRIHRAKLMLELSDMNINEIAKASGFSSSSYFIKVFKNTINQTPQEYRNEHKVS